MQPSSNAVLQAQAIKPNPSRAIEIGIAPDGTSVSIVARRPGAGAVEIVLPSEEIPPLIGALLRTTGLSQRATGN